MGIFGGEKEEPWTIEQVSALGWRELELKMGEALSNKGYTAEVTPPQKDGGRDVDADRIDMLKSLIFRPKLVPRKERLQIDAKQWEQPVGRNPVEKIAEVAENEGGTGVIASPSGFYPAAKRAAQEHGVRLYDGERIVELFNSSGIEIPEEE